MDKVSKSALQNYFLLRKNLEHPSIDDDATISAVRDAKVFALPPALYLQVWNKVCASISEQVLGDNVCDCEKCVEKREFNEGQASGITLSKHFFNSHDLDDGAITPLQSLTNWMVNEDKEGWNLGGDCFDRPLPHKPFSNMYLGYGEGVKLGIDQVLVREQHLDPQYADEDTDLNFRHLRSSWMHLTGNVNLHSLSRRAPSALLLGHLFTEWGEVYEAVNYEFDVYFSVPPEMYSEEWHKRAISAVRRASSGFTTASTLVDKPALGKYISELKRRISVVDWDNFVADRLSVDVRADGSIADIRVRGKASVVNLHMVRNSGWSRNLNSTIGTALDIPNFSGLESRWGLCLSMTSYTVPALLNLLNENNKSFTLERSYDKETRREITKEHKASLPRLKKGRRGLPAYYVINVNYRDLKDPTPSRTTSSEKRSRQGHKLAYRHDRDGHERVLIKRGTLPLDAYEEDALLMRGYSVYTEGQPSDEDQLRLVRRRQPTRREGEWIALKTSWVRSTVVGDESLPYKAAVRRVSLGVAEGLLK